MFNRLEMGAAGGSQTNRNTIAIVQLRAEGLSSDMEKEIKGKEVESKFLQPSYLEYTISTKNRMETRTAK